MERNANMTFMGKDIEFRDILTSYLMASDKKYVSGLILKTDTDVKIK